MRASGRVRIPGFSIGVALALSIAAGVFALASRTRLDSADFTFVNGAEPSTLDPHAVTGVPEMRLMRGIFEGLCVLDPTTLAPLPGMAESWELSPDELTYTFHIRADSRWTNDDVVTAQDFADGFEHLLDPRSAAEYAYLLWCVRGAKRFNTETDASGSPLHPFADVGARAIDARTFVVELERPVPWFLFLAAYPPLAPLDRQAQADIERRFPSTWRTERTRPENLVSNGPFRVIDRRINDRIRLAKHSGYWDRDNVAFDTIDVLASEQLTTNLNLYLTGAAGYLNEIPAALIPVVKDREDFVPAPYLATYFYRVNTTRPPLDDPRVRRALALAIDREAITRKITRAGERPSYALVPRGVESVSGYRPADLRGVSSANSSAGVEHDFARDVIEARRLLAEAGYGPDQPPMRAIEIHYNTQSTNKDVAEVVAHSWRENLGVTAKLVNQEKKVALDTQRRLDYDVSRSTWIADYPDPSTFLEIFGSQNENNRTGFGDARYDELLARASTATGSARNDLEREAEQRLLDAAPILPVYEFVTTNLVDPRLGGFEANALDVHFPKFWYWRNDAELAATRARLALTMNTTNAARTRVESHGPPAGKYSTARRRALEARAAPSNAAPRADDAPAPRQDRRP